jgi:transposase
MEIGKEEAKKKFEEWKQEVIQSRVNCYKSFIKTLDNWMDEITNYFLSRENSGFVEGLNNKIKVLKRRCYGITNITHLFQRIFLDLKGYKLFARFAY